LSVDQLNALLREMEATVSTESWELYDLSIE